MTAIDTDLSVTHQADRLFRIDCPKPAVLHLELEGCITKKTAYWNCA